MANEAATTVDAQLVASANGVGGTTAGENQPPPQPLEFQSAPRRWPALLLGLVVGIGGTMAAVTYFDRQGDGQETDVAAVETATAEVEQRNLIEEIEWSGTLGYGQTASLAGNGGTVTAAAAVGTAIDRGDVLLEIDGEPVIALFGTTPMWRSLSAGDTGADVLQLEANLGALGFDPDQTLDIDDTFTANTALMVERWQEAIGAEVTGTVALGSVMIVEGPSIVSSAAEVGSSAAGPLAVVAPRSVVVDVVTPLDGVIDQIAPVGIAVEPGTVLYHVNGVPVTAEAGLGATGAGLVVAERLVAAGENVIDGGPVLTLSASRLAVEIVVDVAEADEFTVDQEVTIELADGSTVAGVVAEIGPVVASTDPQGSPTVTVEIAVVADESADLVEGTVTVISAGQTVTGATVVPTRALVSLAEGGFAVEKVLSDGSTTLVGIELGSFDDGVVEVVTGEVTPGDDVVVPR